MNNLGSAVARASRWLSAVYALDLELDPEEFLVSPTYARRLLATDCGRVAGPRSGVLAVERDDTLHLGLYVDPRDSDPRTIVEETSHLLCLIWHASHDLPVSRLVLELQGEIDRFLYGRIAQPNAFAEFHWTRFRWADWLEAEDRERYEAADRRALRYCRSLARQFPCRRDTPGLLRELRRFYRSSPEAKLRAAGY